MNEAHQDELFVLERERLAREEDYFAKLSAANLAAKNKSDLEERRRLAAEKLKVRVESKMLVGETAQTGDQIGVGNPAAPFDPNRTAVEQSANDRFLQQSQQRSYEAIVAEDVPFISNTIAEGTFITAALETAIDSSLPGAIRAVVTSDVYSMDGRSLLLPKGTRIVGTYNSVTSLSQKRALVLWTRALTPQGKTIALNAAGADSLGRAGLTGRVDTHFLERFGSAGLISVVTAIPSIIAAELGSTSQTCLLYTSPSPRD